MLYHTNAPLPWQAQERELKQFGVGRLAVAREPQSVVPRSAQMGDDHEERSESANALEDSQNTRRERIPGEHSELTSTHLTFCLPSLPLLDEPSADDRSARRNSDSCGMEGIHADQR
jgi:hypothetical protein